MPEKWVCAIRIWNHASPRLGLLCVCVFARVWPLRRRRHPMQSSALAPRMARVRQIDFQLLDTNVFRFVAARRQFARWLQQPTPPSHRAWVRRHISVAAISSNKTRAVCFGPFDNVEKISDILMPVCVCFLSARKALFIFYIARQRRTPSTIAFLPYLHLYIYIYWSNDGGWDALCGGGGAPPLKDHMQVEATGAGAFCISFSIKTVRANAQGISCSIGRWKVVSDQNEMHTFDKLEPSIYIEWGW